jgi:asparagine synthase (glutamine-hydrolysing)
LIRENRLTIGTLERFAETEGARFAAPLLNPRFLAALGRFGGHASLGDRMESLTAVFDGILPPAVLGRSTKAAFGTVFWGPESRRFAEQWTGAGIPAHLIDPESLRAAWLRDVPVYAAALPLQAAWLASEPGRSATAGA